MERNARMRRILTENRDLRAERKTLADVFLATSGNPDVAKLRKVSDRLDEIEDRLAVLQTKWETFKVAPAQALTT